jgi:serine/threonine protein kinase
MPYVVGIWFIWLMVSTFWVSSPANLFNRDGSAALVYYLSLLAVLSTGIYAQVYRYRHAESLVRKQQLKWIVFGVAVGILTGIGVNLFLTFFQVTKPAAGTYLIVDIVTQTLSVLAQFTVPVAVVFSIQKHRLYDIDLVINRSIIYGLLTVVLALVFGATLWALQTAFELITHQSNPPTIAIIVATIAITSLFQPTRKALQRFINRTVYRIEYDFDEVARREVQFAQAAKSPLHVFSQLGGYQDPELIGRGGMGEIYRAQHPTLHRTVAIKVLSAFFKGDADFRRRFTREAKAMAQLRHPNIITIHDFGEQDEIPYIVMEYLTGKPLSQVLSERGRLSLDEALPLLKGLASALDYAHAQGIIHRDIKPSNVIVEPITTVSSGPTHRAILMDFGIARLTEEKTRLTMSGDVIGTAGYISPEQIRGDMEIDNRADVYSVGILVYETLTGKKPFEHENSWALIRAHLEEPPPDPRDVVPLPEEAARAIMKAMAKKREKRFSSVGEFIATLDTGM